MSKAMLIMDMPESCAKCRLSIFQSDYCTCMASRQFRYKDNKPDWCPLQQVPSKKVLIPYRGHGVVGISELQQNSYQRGYNSCIDEILGGDDDRKQ